jgi:hypothetical protein
VQHRVGNVFLDEQEIHRWKGGGLGLGIRTLRLLKHGGMWSNNTSRRPRICSTQREERLREKRKVIRDNRVRGRAQAGSC